MTTLSKIWETGLILELIVSELRIIYKSNMLFYKKEF